MGSTLQFSTNTTLDPLRNLCETLMITTFDLAITIRKMSISTRNLLPSLELKVVITWRNWAVLLPLLEPFIDTVLMEHVPAAAVRYAHSLQRLLSRFERETGLIVSVVTN